MAPAFQAGSRGFDPRWVYGMRRCYIVIIICAAALVAALMGAGTVQHRAVDPPHDMFDDGVQRCRRMPFDPQTLFMAQPCGEIS